MHINSNFRLSEELYSSEHTRIWRATGVADGSPAILKFLCGGEQVDADSYAQFQREYQLTHELGDIDGVIAIGALEHVQDSLMMVEEDIGGTSLAQLLEHGRIGWRDGLDLAIRVARILDQVHRRGVIHKDLTPSNIIWNPATGALRIIDFGIASQLSQERREFQSVRALEGTLHYVSPEQTGRVNRHLDSRSDIYTLGATLYHLLTGVRPFANRAGIELVHAHIALEPPPPHEIDPALPPVLSAIILKSLAKTAEARYQSAAGLAHDLTRCRDALLATGAAPLFALGREDAQGIFKLPQILYGRAREIGAIVAAFERVASGPAELLLVRGFSGSGKTALVQEVHKPVTQRHGGYIAGKFDQYQRDVPFYAWRMAFEQFCHHLLTEDEATLARWRARVGAAVGPLGKVLADVVPSIELILGPQPAVPPLAGAQALNRLHYVFANFLEAVCLPEHPLVVFIDDWQWADAGSLSLLQAVMRPGRLRSLLLICAYRDNETPPSHPWMLALDDLRQGAVVVDAIDVQPLQPDDVGALVQGALGGADCAPLAQLLFEKTHGNAFFVRQLLTELHHKALLRFDGPTRGWRWNQNDIGALAIADNVVDLMSVRIGRLPEAAQQALLYASCIGDRFELATLAVLLNQPAHQVAEALEQALRAGILTPIGSNYRIARQQSNTANVHYQFIHDRVRQAAYGMLGQQTRDRLHHDIALKWLAELGPEEQQRHIFDIANQFNAGRALISDPRQREQLIAVNLQAGKRAKAATAYSSSLAYFRVALEARAPDHWQRQPGQALELCLGAAEVAFLTQQYGSMELWLDELLAQRDGVLDQVGALKIRVQAYVAQNRLADAVDAALHALRLLGVPLSKAPGQLAVLARVMGTKFALRGKSLDDLRALPAMTDPLRLAAMDMLGLLLPPAYWTSEGLLAMVVCQMVGLSLAHGHSPNAGYGFAWWGITESALLGNIEAGVAFGDFATDLARRHDLNLQQPLFFGAWIIRKFKHPLRSTLPLYLETYALSLEKGDVEYASYARNNYMQTLFHCGSPLPELLDEMAVAHADLQRFQVGSSLYWHSIWWQTARNFATATAQPALLDGDAYREADMLPLHRKANDASTLFLLYCAKLMLAVYFHDHGAALAHARTARPYLKAGVGMHAFVLFHFYESLAMLANLPAAGGRRRRALRQVAANQSKLAKWAGHAPANYRHHWLLVEAERLRLTGKADRGWHYGELAIDAARASGALHEEALAYELAARALRAAGRERLASHYLRQALQAYERWGAGAKTAQLSAAFAGWLATASASQPDLPQGTASRTRPATHGHATAATGALSEQALDMLAITEASQAISREIVSAELLRTLLTIVVEHSGAQRALLLLKQGDSLRIAAQARARQRIEVDLRDLPLDGEGEPLLPVSMVQYVSRTLTTQVIEDARQDPLFAEDRYWRSVPAVSVLCEPVLLQGALVGMLYLENTLTVGAFSTGRLELLRVLAGQAAISIENARLYGDMEARVRARTRELADSLETVRVKSREVSVLLDHSAQGFLSFGADLVVDAQYSRACEAMLAGVPAGRNVADLLFPDDSAMADLMALAVPKVLRTQDVDRRDLMLSLLPAEFERAGLRLAAAYTVLDDGRLMATLTDVTEQRRLAGQAAAEHARLKMVHAAVADSDDFLDSVAAFRHFVRVQLPQWLAAPAVPAKLLQQLYREVHTYKGVLNQFSLQHTPQRLHQLEHQLDALKAGAGVDTATLAGLLEQAALDQALTADLAALEAVLGAAFLAGGARLTLSAQQARQLEQLVGRLLRGETVDVAAPARRAELLRIGNLHRIALRDALAGLERAYAPVAARQHKLVAPLALSGGHEIWLDPAVCRPFLRSLVHVFRNAVAHGIEEPARRLAAGKPDAGQICCTVTQADSQLTLVIADDGAGLDLAALRARAVELGLCPADQAQQWDPARLSELVFHDGLSTSEHADHVAGRGVGLAAVRAEVHKLGGTVTAHSVAGGGAEFRFHLPMHGLAAISIDENALTMRS